MAETLPTLVSRFTVAKQADGRAAHTIADYARALSPFASWCSTQHITAETISRDTVRAYVATLQANGWKPATIAIHIRNLRAFLRWLNVEGYTADNLALAVKAPRQTQRFEIPITADEIQALLNTCAGGRFTDRRDAAMILVLCDTGLRTGELICLTSGNWRREPNADGGWNLSQSGASLCAALFGPASRAADVTHTYSERRLSRAAWTTEWTLSGCGCWRAGPAWRCSKCTQIRHSCGSRRRTGGPGRWTECASSCRKEITDFGSITRRFKPFLPSLPGIAAR